MRFLKASIFIFSSLLSLSWLNAQVLLPEFETPKKLESISSEAEESMPLPYLNGENMYFVRTYVEGSMKQRAMGQEIWRSYRENGEWTEPSGLFEEANDNGNNAVIGTSKDGNTVYVFNSIQTRRKLAKGIAYTRKGEDGEWSDLKKIEIPGFEISDGIYSFYINPSEDVLLISMAASDTTFNEDLFVSTKKDGSWTQVQSLGDVINTPLIETSPYITDDSKVLYFASSGHDGMGQTDIFVSYRQDESWTNWSKPLNLGKPINSTAFDSYFILGNKEEVYFASNRDGKYSDIYYTKFTKKVKNLADGANIVLAQFNYEGLPAEGVTLQILDEEGNLVEEVVTDEYGRFSYTKLNAEEVYVVQIATEDADSYPDGKIYLVEKNGELIARYTNLADGSFSESSDRSELKVVEEQIKGVFNYKNLPLANTALVVLDESGFPIDTIYTDEEGRFEYNKLKQDVDYTLKPLEQVEDPSQLDIAYNSEDELKELDEKVVGVFNYENLPAANTALVVLDENGVPVDTIYTDEKGQFEYSKLDHDKGFTFIPLEKVEDDNQVDIHLIGEENQVAEKPTAKKEAVAEKPKESKPKPKLVDSDAFEVLQFDFNSYYLNYRSKVQLNSIARKLWNNPKMRILLEGHTDTSGTDPVNKEVSLMRAKNAKRYLVSMNIDEDRIEVEGKKDTEPVASNKSREGRIRNRRVEVIELR